MTASLACSLASSPFGQRGINQLPAARGLYDPACEHDACGVGFIAHIKGTPSHRIVEDALTMLGRMDHRGGCGSQANTGDGAGILVGMPDQFLRKAVHRDLSAELPPPGRYGVGMIFLPRDETDRRRCRQAIAKYCMLQGQRLIGWRRVPTDAARADLGPSARSSEPTIEQVFIAAADPDTIGCQAAFERQLYLIRKQAYHEIKERDLDKGYYYVCSISSRVLVYKGQLTSHQLVAYYPDLRSSDFASHVAMVHSRFSTNTFPSWDRAQPMRYMSHNGEINTLRGNVNRMTARQGMMDSPLFGDEFHKLQPVIDPVTSDSGMFDNVLEVLCMAGRSLPEAVMLMIPEAWENDPLMEPTKRAFYEYHANLMEPWDGPASVAFSDGRCVGAVLDRNGLRPSRYYVTHDNRVIMASEVGVLPVEPEKVKRKGRLQPGRMFLVDFEQGRIIGDEELKQQIASARPYRKWLSEQQIKMSHLPPAQPAAALQGQDLIAKLRALGYTSEHMDLLLRPMATDAQEPTGSMGNDTALACLSDQPRLLYDYFKQLFAQVTNPPIDPIREACVMSLQTCIGPEGNLLEATPQQCRRLHLPQPILTSHELTQLGSMDIRDWRSTTIDITCDRQGLSDTATAGQALTGVLDRLCREADQAIQAGSSLLILSDRQIDQNRVTISMLLAVGAVHQHLVRTGQRTRVGLIVETGEAREVHHFACLFGFGADAVNPYLAIDALLAAQRDGLLDASVDEAQVAARYIQAVNKGLLKVMSKMGISTLASYKGAQIFEALGLGMPVIDRCFTGTASRLKGVGFDVLAAESLRRHEIGYPSRNLVRLGTLPNRGEYHWRSGGERHMLDPATIATLQHAARSNSANAYQQFASLVNEHNANRCTLRGLMQLRQDMTAAPLDEVEPAAAIVHRFRTGAMSLGALSREAHETLAIAMNRIGGQSNSGEGGEDPARFTPQPNGDFSRSAIKQIASGRFGVTAEYLAQAKVLQIKMAQGAKPGEGGQLPGFKVDDYIARLRHAMPGVGLISPPPHHDVYSIEDLAQLIFDLKNANPFARVSVKLVSEVGVGTIAAGVAKARADHILIAGDAGGTGAAPLTSIKHAGLPWELGLAEAHQTLVLNDLRSRVRLEVDGQLKTGRDVLIGALLGAEEFGFSTAPLITLGCIMMRKCHLNTCPVGIATQDPRLRAKFAGQPEHVINYLFMVAEECRQYMAQLGIRRFDDLIGRADLLETSRAIQHWKSDGLDLGAILAPAERMHDSVQVRCTIRQDHQLDRVLDRQLIQSSEPAIKQGQPVRITMPIRNTDRAVGTMLSHQVTRHHAAAGLPDGCIHVQFHGSAGQSFGAWLTRGITLELAGDANDYVGKGLCGGRIVVYPPRTSTFKAEQNVIVGNVVLYGATSGDAYFRGIAAERFAVRNSGAMAVVEGVGDHGCEYMTGGRVVVLGTTGRNFAAGMSGGIAYVWDPDQDFATRCNQDSVQLRPIDGPQRAAELLHLIQQHESLTGSTVARYLLDHWEQALDQFVMVMPTEYARLLQQDKSPQAAAG